MSYRTSGPHNAAWKLGWAARMQRKAKSTNHYRDNGFRAAWMSGWVMADREPGAPPMPFVTNRRYGE